MADTDLKASAGHTLGSQIGDWFEEFFVLPLLQKVAMELKLFLDSRFIEREARTGKIQWQDVDGNSVDYDFVLELNGTTKEMGIPVAFIECFWRRGSRHSKDKARDDSGKLAPMRDTYPTARFLGIVAAGDFTNPARNLVRSREIDLFYIPKDKIVKAFSDCKLTMDYPDKAPEDEKADILEHFRANFSTDKKQEVCEKLVESIGTATIESYVDRVRAALSVLPQEIRFILRHDSAPVVFESLDDATMFLNNPTFNMDNPRESYLYQITYSDGYEFEKTVATLEELKMLHEQINVLATHMNTLRT